MSKEKESEKINITEYCLRTHAFHSPHKIALILLETIDQKQTFTFATLFHAVCCLAAGLRSLQLPKSSVVTIRTNQPFDLLLLFLSSMAADLVPIPTPISLSQTEFEFIVKESNSRLVFQLGPTKLFFGLPRTCCQMQDDEYQRLKNFEANDIAPTTTFYDPAFIFYTSGSTGQPKGVLHAHHAILGRKPSLQYWLNIKDSDILMHTDNICWTYSMYTGVLDPLTVGATAVIFIPSNQTTEAGDQISAQVWLDLIQYHQISVLVSSPDIYNRITQIAHSGASYPSLRLAGSAGSPLSELTQQQWQSIFHFPIYSAFGMSELSTFISSGPTIPIRGNKLGKIQPGRKVLILPLEEGVEPVPLCTIGMLAIHKTELGFMLGYVGERQELSSMYRKDWFLTQDLVSQDEEGYLSYYGRADNILNVGGGFRVSPIEIEEVLKKFPQIIDVACGSVFDSEIQTDILVAYIVSSRSSKTFAKQIYEFAQQYLSGYKIPNLICFVDKLPRNQRGKLMRNQLSALKNCKYSIRISF